MEDCKALDKSSALRKELKGFKCRKLLGNGSFGATFLMVNKNNEKVVVKSIFKKFVKEVEVINEISILKRLQTDCSKEHVMCHFNSIKTDKEVYIITEYLKGMDMFTYYHSKYKVPTLKRNTFMFIKQLIDGLDYIHKLGVIHFDIKPENLMVNEEGSLKIIDFGGAVYSKNQDRITQTIYTLPYFKTRKYGDTPMNITYNEGKWRDFYAFFKTFRNETPGVISPLHILMGNNKELKTSILFNLFKTDFLCKYNYRLRLLSIKKLL